MIRTSALSKKNHHRNKNEPWWFWSAQLTLVSLYELQSIRSFIFRSRPSPLEEKPHVLLIKKTDAIILLTSMYPALDILIV